MHEHQSFSNEKFLRLTTWPSTWSKEQYDFVTAPFGSIPSVRPQEIKRIVKHSFNEAAYLVDPLLRSVLQYDDTPLKDLTECLDQVFTCIDISDDDLPWQDST
ncbi:hypothetical protein N7G274_010420 [Stereocaulon virgatum]|uniref:Uncharacterized protein n=1 Tax=Stereocaulon virgatum TaxID=373712 RepID=A0ABR3ZTN2_9LECA